MKLLFETMMQLLKAITLTVCFMSNLRLLSMVARRVKEYDESRETYGDARAQKVRRHVGQKFYHGTDFVLDGVVPNEASFHQC